MLTKATHQDEDDSISRGIISITSALDLAASLADSTELRGTLILAGEEDDHDSASGSLHDDDNKSKLTLPESVLLPSEMTLKVSPVVAKEEKNANHNDGFRTPHDGYTIPQPVLLPLVALLFLTTCVTSWGYIKSQNEIHLLNTSLQLRKNVLPFTALLLKERHALNKKMALLLQKRSCHRDTFNQDDTNMFGQHDNATFTLFENCYFKASLSTGPCYQNIQTWLRNYTMFDTTASQTTTTQDEEYYFASQLLNGMKSTSYQSYSYIESSLKNMTFDSLDIGSILTSSITALGGVHNHNNVKLQESLSSIAKNVVEETSFIANNALEFSTGWLRNVFQVVSEDDLVSWN
eukprot:scaffold1734_cov64-Cyclotella_meneghiniana.AAC.9